MISRFCVWCNDVTLGVALKQKYNKGNFKCSHCLKVTDKKLSIIGRLPVTKDDCSYRCEVCRNRCAYYAI